MSNVSFNGLQDVLPFHQHQEDHWLQCRPVFVERKEKKMGRGKHKEAVKNDVAPFKLKQCVTIFYFNDFSEASIWPRPQRSNETDSKCYFFLATFESHCPKKTHLWAWCPWQAGFPVAPRRTLKTRGTLFHTCSRSLVMIIKPTGFPGNPSGPEGPALPFSPWKCHNSYRQLWSSEILLQMYVN